MSSVTFNTEFVGLLYVSVERENEYAVELENYLKYLKFRLDCCCPCLFIGCGEQSKSMCFFASIFRQASKNEE